MKIDDLLTHAMMQLPESTVRTAMAYSLTAGGKRIRPNMLYAVLKGYGVDEVVGDEFACALEMIHTYSLIHDDLPAMDNDDLRRGLPTCHKKFGEATAILAGDGLLTYAFQIASSSKQLPAIVNQCISVLATMAGAQGMVYGQQLDIEAEEKNIDWHQLQEIHRHKTGCLLTAPLLVAAILSNRPQDLQYWQHIGYQLGLAFQMQDDVLDVELTAEQFGKSNSDMENHKGTVVSILGIEKAKELMDQLYCSAVDQIRSIPDYQADALLELIDQIRTRNK